MIGYCLKCKKKRQMEKEKQVLVKNRKAIKGVCNVCGTQMFKFI